MERSEIEELLTKYLKGKASAEESALVESWYLARGKELPAVKEEIDYNAKKQELWGRILERRGRRLPAYRKLWPRIAAAASVVMALSIGGYLLLHKEKDTLQTSSTAHDIAPGGNKAILTLADGRQLSLNDMQNGLISKEGAVQISKTGDGDLWYEEAAAGNSGAPLYNTLSTPKGGEYHVMLPDGTNVWLNAASSIRYPVRFSGKDRRVELTGEAYFEVANDKSRPFKVTSGKQTVEVLGTHFNIMAYAEERAMRTTLLEGSVKVAADAQSALLKPGQEALVSDGVAVQEADTDLAVAWKNGRTYFKDADIPTMMRSLARWYNVDIEYRGDIPERIFTGGIPRTSNLSTMLKILGEMNIHAHIEGRRIIVTP